jgi:cancer susceptibility candidate protein 1
MAESRLYRQMSLVASTMAFSWSRWNTDVNDQEKIIFQAAEHLVDEALFEVCSYNTT